MYGGVRRFSFAGPSFEVPERSKAQVQVDFEFFKLQAFKARSMLFHVHLPQPQNKSSY
jgi:hypothetical protein